MDRVFRISALCAVLAIAVLAVERPLHARAQGRPLYVAVTDSKGDPVTGKKVRATFSGPGTQGPLDGAENVAELGPGRYRFNVPGLDAGSWKITLSLGDGGSGVYDLEVSR